MSSTFDPSQDYYALLGISWVATKSELEDVYDQCVREFFPDKPGGHFGSADDFMTKKKAYEVLNNPDMRAKYDSARMSYIIEPESGYNLRPRVKRVSHVEAVVIKQEPSIKQEYEFDVSEGCMLSSTTTFSTYFHANYREKPFLTQLRDEEKAVMEHWTDADLAARNAKNVIKHERTLEGRQFARSEYMDLKLVAEQLRLRKQAVQDDRRVHREIANRLLHERKDKKAMKQTTLRRYRR